ncbi:MAG: saccharopine dehydrogenase NADP-binding domain-containing protein [Candidatus Hydrogenedentes bacterium]|nr:saccharopine dehydrogenase NADP-binding domain-containing protein [Candidatus Hydrogenedentota bacterium]
MAKRILLLGAYGLAGRSILRQLIERTSFEVLATGRNEDRLQQVVEPFKRSRIDTAVVDVLDGRALSQACADADLVINATGPYAVTGAETARSVINCGTPYLDFANEQIHYRRLQNLKSLAKARNVPVITAAGAIPGISTMLAVRAAHGAPGARTLDLVWAQGRMDFEEGGLGSLMGGLLETGFVPRTVEGGREVQVILGSRRCTRDLPAPFGPTALVGLPTIDALLLPKALRLDTLHTWWAMGTMPPGAVALVRLLAPHRRPWSYRLVKRLLTSLSRYEYRHAVKQNKGTESILLARMSNGGEWSGYLRFPSGGYATAILPVLLAQRVLEGEPPRAGLHTPLDLLTPEEVFAALNDLGIALEAGPTAGEKS